MVDELQALLNAKLIQASRESALAEAIRYAFTAWHGSTRFLDDGRIELDSRAVERSIQPIVLSRKNGLFAGSDDGGDHWAVITSLARPPAVSGAEPVAHTFG